MKKIAVYTCIINPNEPFGKLENYDSLKKLNFLEEGVDYFCFSNNPKLKSDQYNIVHIDIEDNATRTSRIPKIKPHLYFENYDYSIYIDGSTTILRPIRGLVEKFLGDSSFAMRHHDKRSCVYEEGKKIIEMYETNPKDTPESVNGHLDFYKSINFPENFGLFATGVLIRNHNDPRVIKCMNSWWDMYSKGSIRDQLSLPYSFWKNDFDPEILPQKIFDQYFRHSRHRIKYGKIRDV